ncbi:MAG: murein biosynthesis integral membrane protein MurJ [Oligoflexia bacterium]|nr:murein biosynthesis integral membrane protein MurJ [Oligoflexia bacterium]
MQDQSLKDLQDSERKQVAVSAFWVALGTMTSRVLGLMRELVIAHYFSRTATDAFFVAFRLPNLFRRIFGEGALTVSFIPVLTDFLKNDDKKGARELVSSVFTLLFVVLSILTILGTYFASPTVTLLSGSDEFLAIPGKLELTIHQARIMFCYIMLVSFYAFAMGILNTLKIFWLPAVAPALWNISLLTGVIFFRDRFEISSDVLAWATVVGGFLQLGLLIPALKRSGFFPRFRKWWGNPAVNRVLRAMGPSILGLSVMQLGVLINTYFASSLEEGSNSWIFYADRLLELPLSIFAVSLGTVTLPALSAFWSRGDVDGMGKASMHAVRLSLFMAIPCAAGLFMLSHEIIYSLYEHGKFTAHDTLMTGSVLKVYGIGVIFATCVRVFAPAFYAMKNTWLPALAAAIALTCHVFIASVFTKMYGVTGLAASSTISGAINFLILIIAYQKLVVSLDWRTLTIAVSKFILASLVLMGVSLIYGPLSLILGPDHWARVVCLLVTVTASALAYFLTSWLLKVPELTETLGEFQKRIKSKFKRK